MAHNIFFDEFVDPFVPGPFVIRAEHYMRYMFARNHLQRFSNKAHTIYDLGCGNGYGMRIMANGERKFADIYVGFDKSPELIREAEKRKIPESKWILVDFDKERLSPVVTKQKLPSPDVVIAFEIIEHVEDPDTLLKQLYEVLPEHGLLIGSVPNERYEPKKKGKPKNKFHKHLFSAEKITSLLNEAGFGIVQLYGQPYPNRLYHYPKIINRFLDLLTNTLPFTFIPLAHLIATPRKNMQEKSYSIIFSCEKK